MMWWSISLLSYYLASKPRVERGRSLYDARLIYSLHGRYSHDRTSVMSLIN